MSQKFDFQAPNFGYKVKFVNILGLVEAKSKWGHYRSKLVSFLVKICQNFDFLSENLSKFWL